MTDLARPPGGLDAAEASRRRKRPSSESPARPRLPTRIRSRRRTAPACRRPPGPTPGLGIVSASQTTPEWNPVRPGPDAPPSLVPAWTPAAIILGRQRVGSGEVPRGSLTGPGESAHPAPAWLGEGGPGPFHEVVVPVGRAGQQEQAGGQVALAPGGRDVEVIL